MKGIYGGILSEKSYPRPLAMSTTAPVAPDRGVLDDNPLKRYDTREVLRQGSLLIRLAKVTDVTKESDYAN